MPNAYFNEISLSDAIEEIVKCPSMSTLLRVMAQMNGRKPCLCVQIEFRLEFFPLSPVRTALRFLSLAPLGGPLRPEWTRTHRREFMDSVFYKSLEHRAL